jgi:ribosome biogenesis GTPase
MEPERASKRPAPSLAALGWSPFFAEHWQDAEPGSVAGRVTTAHREQYLVTTEAGALACRISGRLRHAAATALDLPTVGDWVGVAPGEAGQEGRILTVLPRRSRFVRQAAGKRTDVQVVAANVDWVAVVTTPDNDFSLRRLERYLTAIRESGASPLFILNKTDLCEEPAAFIEQLRQVDVEVPVLATSAARGQGVEGLASHLGEGQTLVLVGSSGVGKSTLVNALLEERVQRTGAIRARDGRGVHVTSHRELFVLPRGGILMDTPGMREFQVWAFDPGAMPAFDDIGRMATECRFRDCTHHTEPGCAVRRAVEEGRIAPERVEGFRKLEKEVQLQRERQEGLARVNAKRRWAPVSRAIRRFRKG